MATTGTYTESLDNADFIGDAYERIGKDPDSLIARHIKTALRSLTFLMAEWELRGIRQYKIETLSFDSSTGFDAGTDSITLPDRVIRILHVYHRTGSSDTDLLESSRQEFDSLNSKEQSGSRPDRYYLERTTTPVIHLWPLIDNSSDTLFVVAFVRIQDIGVMSNNPDTPRRWWEALVSGLAAKLAEKYAPERLVEKIQLAETAFKLAKGEERETGPTRFRMKARRR